jgi:dihydrofolate synthase/folylpolyglutamate synthase
MNYPESVQFLYALGNEIKTAKLGLERIAAVCAALGDPQKKYRVVHVAGTNGKGSTCAMIEAALGANGEFTGLYTSPHLVAPTERIRIAGKDVSVEQFTAAFQRVHSVSEELMESGLIDAHPTYFETVTAMGFWLFAEAGVETAVIEVGLGGRLDATNIVEPQLCVITPVDFDHEQYLGNTIAAIAGEKAGILKPWVPAVIARQHAEAEAVIRRKADEVQAPLLWALDEVAHDVRVDAWGSEFTVGDERLRCLLPGEHQVSNAVTAALALSLLECPREGIALAKWPGRLERVRRRPDLVLDGAHNPSGARALARWLERFHNGRRVHMIFGTMRDKAVDEVAETLFPLADDLVFTAPESARSLHPDTLKQVSGREDARVAANLREAIALVGEVPPEDLMVITGSLFLVGEARALFGRV